MKPRGMSMIGALVRAIQGTGILKIVTGYRCDATDEMIQFAGDSKTSWVPLTEFEILSDEH